MKILKQYYHWLHGQWPSGEVEQLPEVGVDGMTNVKGVRIVGDLSGVPLLKFSSETGTQAIHAILSESSFAEERASKPADVVDVAIIGAGISGVSAAIEAKKAGLSYILLESSEVFSTIVNFPKAKPIFTYPTDMVPSGGIQYDAASDVKERLLDDVRKQLQENDISVTHARIDRVEKKDAFFQLVHADDAVKVTKALRCVIAIGRSGDYRKLGVLGEELNKVSNRLHDPKEYKGKSVLVVGGGDSAAEAAIALADAGADVTLSYRKLEFSRPKPENVRKVMARDGKSISLKLGTSVKEIRDQDVLLLDDKKSEQVIKNDYVFSLLGREAPLDFFRRSGIAIANDKTQKWWITLFIGLLVALWMYHWKKELFVGTFIDFDPKSLVQVLFAKVEDTKSLFYTIKEAALDRSFYYSLAYCVCVTVFGLRRIKRRQTPYVTAQTSTLMGIQWSFLFLIPAIVLPWMGKNEFFVEGAALRPLADALFESYDKGIGIDRAYWRAYGFILAWPLFLWNLFTDGPMWAWLIISLVQTFLIIPWMVRKWGKGAYCGWICSCGGLAETMGDAHRHKMPHGAKWTKLNMIGQIFLGFAFVLLALKMLQWVSGINAFAFLVNGYPLNKDGLPILNYSYLVDLLWAGVIGVAFYFHFSGRVWCRFACPLAALMHIYSRFGKFRIFAEKSKCISCNVCTSVCHQGIDIMNFANKGKPMEDPQCVRCSACVQQCPTGVLSFGRIDEQGNAFLDKLQASPVQMRERRNKV